MNLIGNSTKFLLLLVLSVDSFGETISCGLKKVTVQDHNISKIIHEDGTVHTGGSIYKNWKYDGKSIKHRLFDKPIPCGTKPKSRDEIITELSRKTTEKPSLYGMTQQEAEQMSAYTANLMRINNECYLLVDTAKSTSRKGMFYIDCNDKLSNTSRYWVSERELKQSIFKNATSPLSDSIAIKVCSQELKMRTNNPSTYAPSLLLGTSSQKIKRVGRNVIEIEFEASNAFGIEDQYIGRCILEGGAPIEVTINKR